ncbi:MAG TPA: type IV pilin protein [Casimicrobiaceae bacterium]|nr:type IV pilin protein [Casimicrobiaceae bacterium]
MRIRGFTLIEVLIVCVIVGVLTMIALPSYQKSVQKTRRSDAKSALIGAAGQMERYFTERGTYATATLGSGSGNVYPSTTENGYYTLSLANLTATTYTLRAAPAAAQTGDACGTMTYTDQGTKGVSGASLPASECW